MLHSADATPLVAPAPTPTPAPRPDLYAPIHKALRLFMTDTLGRWGRTDGADLAELRGAVDQLIALLSLLRAHIAHENQFMHPALEARCAGSARRIAGEHDEHLASIDALECEANAMTSAPAPQREALALRLYRHLALFVAENLQHMHVEETAHNQALWDHYSDDELWALHQALVDSIAPDEMARVLHWMTPALSLPELSGMLAEMRDNAPAPVFEATLAQVQSRLPTDRWARLAKALGVPAAPGLVDLR